MTTRLENKRARKGILTFAVLVFLFTSFAASELCALGKFQNYPGDGKLKQISTDNDQCYFIDKNDRYVQAAGETQGLGIYKGYDQAYHESWSPRDLLKNTLRMMTGWINSDKYKIWMDWENDGIVLKFGISFK